jgi:hypothetical protein
MQQAGKDTASCDYMCSEGETMSQLPPVAAAQSMHDNITGAWVLIHKYHNDGMRVVMCTGA